MVIEDIFGNKIRLTEERKRHILEHKEMENQLPLNTFTPVTEKYLTVIVKFTIEDNFILTSFFTDKIKEGRILWEN